MGAPFPETRESHPGEECPVSCEPHYGSTESDVRLRPCLRARGEGCQGLSRLFESRPRKRDSYVET